MTIVAGFGSWRSPITSELIVGSTIGFGDLALEGGRAYWAESRPGEGGRVTILCDDLVELTPAPFSARTTAHEYGGGAYVVWDGTLGPAVTIAGGADESIVQPEWSPDGVLHFISDRSGWWNLHRVRGGAIEPVAPIAAELAQPQWQFGMSSYAFDSSGALICAY